MSDVPRNRYEAKVLPVTTSLHPLFNNKTATALESPVASFDRAYNLDPAKERDSLINLAKDNFPTALYSSERRNFPTAQLRMQAVERL